MSPVRVSTGHNIDIELLEAVTVVVVEAERPAAVAPDCLAAITVFAEMACELVYSVYQGPAPHCRRPPARAMPAGAMTMVVTIHPNKLLRRSASCLSPSTRDQGRERR